MWLQQQPANRVLFERVSSPALLSLASVALYWAGFSYRQPVGKTRLLQFIRHYLLLMLFSMGLSLHNTRAVLEGYMGRKSQFVRTPKFNRGPEQPSPHRYVSKSRITDSLGELLLCVYFLAGIGSGIYLHNFSLLPLHLALLTGFGLVSYYSIVQSVAFRKTQRKRRSVLESVNELQ